MGYSGNMGLEKEKEVQALEKKSKKKDLKLKTRYGLGKRSICGWDAEGQFDLFQNMFFSYIIHNFGFP